MTPTPTPGLRETSGTRSQSIRVLFLLALPIVAAIGFHRYRVEAPMNALHKSSSRGGGYVFLPRAHNVRITMRLPVTVNENDGYLDAYETVAFPKRSDAVAICLQTAMPWSTRIDCRRGASIFASLFGPLQARIVNVVFHDGSKRAYAYSREAQRYLPVPGSASDAHGNGIPENLAMVSNGGGISTYGFDSLGPSYDQINLVSRLSRLGVQGDYADETHNGLISCALRVDDSTYCKQGL